MSQLESCHPPRMQGIQYSVCRETISMTKPSARARLEAALAKIADPKGEGARACLTVYREQALAAAVAADARAHAGILLGPLDGVIVSIKDLFDVAGEVTRAGSKVLAEEGKPAEADAPVVRRLRSGGAVIVAKTNTVSYTHLRAHETVLDLVCR